MVESGNWFLFAAFVVGAGCWSGETSVAANRPPECSKSFVRMWDTDREIAFKHLPKKTCLMRSVHDAYLCDQTGCSATFEDSSQPDGASEPKFPDCPQKFLASWLWDRETALAHLPVKACILYGEHDRYICDRSGCQAQN